MSMKLYPDGVQEMNVTPVRAPQNSTSEESELIKSIGTIVDTRIAGHISTLSSMFRDERRRSPQSASTRHHLSGDEHSNESDNCITNTSFSPDIIKKPPYFRTPAPTDQRPDQSEIKASSPDYAAGVDFDLPGRVIDIRGDGHCLLHAAAKCLEAERHPECSSEDIKRKLMEEWHAHKDTYYCPFLGASVQDVEKELEDYTELKHFDSDSGDLIVSLLCNAMETEITIYYGMEMRAEGAGSKGSISHPPGRKEIKAKYFIKLLREGEGNFAHYSAIINAPNTNPTPQNTPTFPKKIAA